MTVDTRAQASELWWLPLITGTLWVLFALVIFRFDYTSASALSILVGLTCLAGAGAELISLPNARGWWRLAHVGLALAFAIVGIVAFADPTGTVEAVGAVFAFYLLLRGLWDVIASLLVRGDLWGLELVAGLAQIALAFWAAGDFGHKAILLVVWIGGSALIHGVVLIVAAFRLRPA